MVAYIESSFGQWKLSLGSSYLGRGTDCAIRLDDLRLSRHHAELTFDGKKLQIRDLGSMNGVLVDGDRISDTQTLSDGSEITLGPFTFSVRFASDEKGPSRSASEAMVQRGPPQRKPSNDFSPSTDCANKKAIDFDKPYSTPLAKASPAKEGRPVADAASSALTQRKTNNHNSGERRIAPLIEKALKEDELTDKSGRKDTDTLFPSHQGEGKKSDALLPIDEDGNIRVNAEDELQLTPFAVEEAARHKRLGAIIGDTIIIGCAMTICLLVGTATGLLIIEQTGTQMSLDGQNLLASLNEIHQAGSLPWISLLGCTALGLIAALVVALYLVVGGKCLHGGAPCHRRMGLVLIDRRSGHFPTPWCCLLHSALGCMSAPLIPIFLLMGKPALHDRLVGCNLRRRSRV